MEIFEIVNNNGEDIGLPAIVEKLASDETKKMYKKVGEADRKKIIEICERRAEDKRIIKEREDHLYNDWMVSVVDWKKVYDKDYKGRIRKFFKNEEEAITEAKKMVSDLGGKHQWVEIIKSTGNPKDDTWDQRWMQIKDGEIYTITLDTPEWREKMKWMRWR